MTTSEASTKAAAHAISPLFLVPDVARAAEHYRGRLGFHVLNYYGDPPCFVMVRRGNVEIMLKLAESPEQVQPNGAHGSWDAYIWVSDFDAIKAELAANGAKIVCENLATPYGTNEIEVDDRDGYRICFAQDTTGGS